jgi:hypothetical protein
MTQKYTQSELINFVNLFFKRTDGKYKRFTDAFWKKNKIEHLRDCFLKLTNFLENNSPWAQRFYHIENDIYSPVLCNKDVCDNVVLWDKQKSSYKLYCSKSCSSTCNKVLEKFTKTNQERYGDHPMRNLHIRKKLKNSLTDKYGVSSYSKTEHHRNMMKTDNPMFNPAFVANFNKTNQERYGTTYYNHARLLDKDIIANPDKFCRELATVSPREYSNIHGIDGNTVIKYLRLYDREDLIGININYSKGGPSAVELKLQNLLTKLNVDFVSNDRTILKPKELDIYIPSFNTAIEVNGIYWHSDCPTNRPSLSHFDKWKQCKELGIDLYSMTDSDINNKWNIIENKIRYLVNASTNKIIGARKCLIRDCDSITQERDLLNKNHIQGFLKSRDGTLGAYYNNQLVAVINWKQRKHYLEITRYCCDTSASYPGLFSKMMKAMVIKLGYKGKLVSFSNNDHSNGNVYKQAGFHQEQILGPAYWYTKDFVTLENRQNYMKAKIAKKFNIDVSNKTERQLMSDLGYYRYYDSGKIKWSIEI